MQQQKGQRDTQLLNTEERHKPRDVVTSEAEASLQPGRKQGPYSCKPEELTRINRDRLCSGASREDRSLPTP